MAWMSETCIVVGKYFNSPMRFRHLVSVVVLIFVWTWYASLPQSVEICNKHPIPAPPRTDVSCPVTWVTAYYRFSSKHSVEEYNAWIRNFQAIRMCVVVFTDVLDMWLHLPNTTLVVPTSLCPVALYHLKLSVSEWQKQFSMDPERGIHRHFMVYWVWALKTFFLNSTVTSNPFNSNAFFWIDAGYFRDDQHDGLDIRSMRTRLVPDRGLVFLQRYPFTKDEINMVEDGRVRHPVLENRMGGGMFGGHAQGVRDWTGAYEAELAMYQARNWFVGKDQVLMASICLTKPWLCTGVAPLHNTGVDEWMSLFESVINASDVGH